MSAHTPGPWAVGQLYGSTQVEISAPGRAIAIVWNRRGCRIKDNVESWPEGEANARLIAAAPDLLAYALQQREADRLQDITTDLHGSAVTPEELAALTAAEDAWIEAQGRAAEMRATALIKAGAK